MSDTESHQAYIDASEASIPAENGPREVANDPPPLGSAEERENDPGVAARTRLQRRQQNVAGADIIDRARIAAPPTRSDPPEESTSLQSYSKCWHENGGTAHPSEAINHHAPLTPRSK